MSWFGMGTKHTGVCLDSTHCEPEQNGFDQRLEQYLGEKTSKATNPKDGIAANKMPLHLWPETATIYGCLALLSGMLKYGRSNWRVKGVLASVYVDATKRHLNAWFEGQDMDVDSGLPHLAHALASLAVLVDAISAGNLVDDRNVKGGYSEAMVLLTPMVAVLKARKEGQPAPRHYTIADNMDTALW